MLADRVELVVDSVTEIKASARSVRLASGDPLDYDYLVYAVGSTSGGPVVPGSDEFAYQMARLEETRQARSALQNPPVTAPVSVVGCFYGFRQAASATVGVVGSW